MFGFFNVWFGWDSVKVKVSQGITKKSDMLGNILSVHKHFLFFFGAAHFGGVNLPPVI